MTNVGVMASAVNLGGPCTDVLMEPFDNWTAWTDVSVVPPGLSVVSGRTGTAGKVAGSVLGAATYAIPAPGQSDTITIGFAFRVTALGSESDIVQLQSDSGSTEHTKLRINSAGSLIVYRGPSALATTAAGTVAINTWYYIELRAKLHDTAGSYDLRVNGVSIASASNVDMKNGGTKTVYDTVRLATNYSSADNLYDDLYLSAGAGCGFKGDITVPSPSADVLLEPFDNFTMAPWTTAGSPSIVAGRTGTAAQMNSVTQTARYTLAAPAQSDYMTVGFAWRTNSLANSPHILKLAGNANNILHNSLAVATDGTLSTYRGTKTGVVLGSSAPGVVTINTWYYIEIQIRLDDTLGTVTVRLNASPVITVTNVDTRTTGATTFDTVGILADIGTTNLYDDLYVSVGAGAPFKGPITIP